MTLSRITVEHHGLAGKYEERVHAWAKDEVVEMAIRAGFMVKDVKDGGCFASFAPRQSERMVAWHRQTT